MDTVRGGSLGEGACGRGLPEVIVDAVSVFVGDEIALPWEGMFDERNVRRVFGRVSGSDFPFELGGQAAPAPLGVCARFVMTHVADRFIGVGFV